MKDRSTTVATGTPRPIDPTEAAMTAGLLARGSMPSATAFPGMAQWHLERRLAAYSCGGSRGVSPHSLFTPSPGHRPFHAYRAGGDLSSLGVEIARLEIRPGAVMVQPFRQGRPDDPGRRRAPPRQDDQAQGSAGPGGRLQNHREGAAHRPYGSRQGQVDRGLRADAAGARPGLP